MNYINEIEHLYLEQATTWEFMKTNYTDLDNVKLKTVDFGNCQVILQFNPKRILSSGAKVDHQSISERPCFLCDQNRPPEQKGILYQTDYCLLLNPYPVFRRHLTIPTVLHKPQLILDHFKTLLSLAADMEGYTLIYNGPRCGASAPDHFHFQAVYTNEMPISADFKSEQCCRLNKKVNDIEVFSWINYIRNPVTLMGKNPENILGVLTMLYKGMLNFTETDPEPMMNILAVFRSGNWIIHVFPRSKHRPSQFYEEGNRRILTSPGSIDLSGFLVMAREEDFNKITKADIVDIYNQVCLNDAAVEKLISNLN